MNFKNITPENAGVSSKDVKALLKFYQDNGVILHSVLLMKGNDLFGEFYYKPFDKDFCHRMYSETKSYVGIAIGLLEEEGKLKLDDKIVDFFPEKIDGELHEYLKDQTIEEMLCMTTCGVEYPYWFTSGDPDRTHMYLNKMVAHYPAGTAWSYDSTGSQVLCNLVEKLSGKSLFDYLNEKIFSHLETFKNATILKTPNGDSWGDSALICTSRDMISFARFVMNYGTWNGKRLMNERYLKKATSCVVGNATSGFRGYENYGYGYQIWRHQHGFSFNGMGSQFTICVPKKDLIMVCTASNCGYTPVANSLIFAGFEAFIINKMQDVALSEDKEAFDSLVEYANSLEIEGCMGEKTSITADKINQKTYIFRENPKGFKNFKFKFDGDGGILYYENPQGKKQLEFKMQKNQFTKFPQFGYSNLVGAERTTDGFTYDCAVSAGWIDENRLMIRVQVIDKYFGNLAMVFSFKDKVAVVSMNKVAEDFFNEYTGNFVADLQE